MDEVIGGAAAVKNTDAEGDQGGSLKSWRQAGQRRWLWLAATPSAACFKVGVGRGKAALRELLGEAIQGVVCRDRWSAYNLLDLAFRQPCPELRRDRFHELFDSFEAQDKDALGTSTTNAQERHQGRQIHSQSVRPNVRGDLRPSAMTTSWTTAPMPPMLRNHRRGQGHLGHLMPPRFGIAGLGRLRQRSLATPTHGRPMVHDLVDSTEGKTFAGMTRMSRLSARFASRRRFAGTLWRLGWIAGGRTR